MAVHEARHERAAAEAAGNKAREHAAERGTETSGADLATNLATGLGNVLTLAGAATTKAITVTGAGVIAGAPVQAFSLGRETRKLAKQSARHDRLKQVALTSWDNSDKALQGLVDAEDALTQQVDATRTAIAAAQLQRDRLVASAQTVRTRRAVRRLKGEITQAQSDLARAESRLTQAEADRVARETTSRSSAISGPYPRTARRPWTTSGCTPWGRATRGSTGDPRRLGSRRGRRRRRAGRTISVDQKAEARSIIVALLGKTDPTRQQEWLDGAVADPAGEAAAVKVLAAKMAS